MAQSATAESFQTTIFIHTSKPTYVPGEKIWLSAYLLNAHTQQLLKHKHPLYVQLYAANGKLVANQVLDTEEGRGEGALALLPSNPVGIYRLRAFTQSMVMAKQDSYEQRIYVGIEPTNKPKTEIKTSNLLKIVADSAKYAQRSPVRLLLHADSTLQATISVSVYKETAPWHNNRFVLPPKTSTDTPELAEELLYMGRAMRENGSVIANGQVMLLMDLPNGQRTFMADTDSTGFFIFKNLVFEGEKTAYWQVNNAKGRAVSDASIHWIKFPRIAAKIDSLPVVKENIGLIQRPAVFLSDGDSLAVDAKMLDEVTIKAKKEETPVYMRAMLHKEKDVSFAINFENNQLPNTADGSSFYTMLRMLPPCGTSDPPIYLIDGAKLFANGKPHEMVDTRRIKRIEFLRGASGWIYGSTCVYAIYTHGVESKTTKNNVTPPKTVKLESYEPTKSFYSPNHANKTPQETDNRQTLYWNPSLVLEPNQKQVSMRFFTSAISGSYRVVVQGMSNAGPVYAETTFSVE